MGGAQGDAIVDSACAVSVMSSRFARLSGLLVSPSSARLTAANATPLVVQGRVEARVRLSPFVSILQSFLVVDEIPADMLLGWDMLRTHSASI